MQICGMVPGGNKILHSFPSPNKETGAAFVLLFLPPFHAQEPLFHPEFFNRQRPWQLQGKLQIQGVQVGRNHPGRDLKIANFKGDGVKRKLLPEACSRRAEAVKGNRSFKTGSLRTP